MPNCPRRHRPAAKAPTTCSPCGCAVPAIPETTAPTSPTKLFLGVIAALLVAGLIALAIFYLQNVTRLLS